MITKIVKISGIGRFKEKAILSAVVLNQFTVIYAPNGSGKTTFGAILRSAGEGNSQLILERRSLGFVDDPNVQFLLDGKMKRFQAGAWAGPSVEVVVFDTQFVNDNVYSGGQIDHDHRRNLYSITVGSQGVVLARDIDRLDGELREVNAQIAVKEQAVSSHVLNGFPLAKFVVLAPIEELATKIADVEQKVQVVENLQSVLNTPDLEDIRLSEFSKTDFLEVMAGSIEGVVANAEELVRTHLELHQQHINEDWLAVGAKVGSESCPFCGQPVPASDLVGAYRVFFSQAYRETKSRATRLRELVRKNFQEQQIQALKHLLEKNVALEEQWKQRGLPGMDGSLDPTQVHEIMMQLRNEVLKCLQEKEKAPLEPVEIGASCTQAMTNFMELEAAVQTYQQALREMKTRVEKYKSELPGLNLPELRERLSLLQNTQQRHRPEVAAVVAQLQERRDHKKTLTREKTAAKQSLDEYTANVFAAHEKRVNQHLEKAGAGFRIIETTTSYQGGKPRSDYKFAVDGHHVQLAGATPNASGPTFRTALSEGDKSTLAFGFFLSTLEQTAHLDKTLIVIDDPLTSLDSGRRAYTRSEILRLSARCKQLIVLTHDPMFGHSLAETNPQQVATLEIKRFKFGSQIQNWDSSLAIQEPYFRMFNDLVAYLDTDYKFDPLTIVRHLRPVVEGTIRYRIPGFKLKDATLGKYIALIREATLEHPLRTLKSWLEELDAINAYCVSKNHDDPNADRIDEQELRHFVSRVLSFVEGIGFGQTVDPD